MNRPDANEKCARCPHPFSQHFTSYGGQTGCSHVTPAGGDQRDNWPEKRCACGGFAIQWQDSGSGVMTR